MKEADRVVLGIVRTQGVGTNEFGKVTGLVGLGRTIGPHFMENDGHALLEDLPGGFAAGQSAPNDVDGV